MTNKSVNIVVEAHYNLKEDFGSIPRENIGWDDKPDCV